jgi:hypothetical protein
MEEFKPNLKRALQPRQSFRIMISISLLILDERGVYG